MNADDGGLGTMRTALLTLSVCVLALPANAQYSGGTGEPNDPYQIATAADLIALGETPEDYNKHFILTADIDLEPNLPGRKVFDRAVIAPGWKTWFMGVFDGRGHSISNLTITGESDLVGLFGRLGPDARVSNLGLEAVEVSGSGDYVGGLVGYNYGGSITTSYSSGSVSGTSRVGGLVGFSHTGRIIDCTAAAWSAAVTDISAASWVAPFTAASPRATAPARLAGIGAWAASWVATAKTMVVVASPIATALARSAVVAMSGASLASTVTGTAASSRTPTVPVQSPVAVGLWVIIRDGSSGVSGTSRPQAK